MTAKIHQSEFYVIQFVRSWRGLPFDVIDDYVCIPHEWVLMTRRDHNKAIVVYPKDEEPFVTRDRVERKEKHKKTWKCYEATIKYETNIYRDAVNWIAKINDKKKSIKHSSKRTDTQEMFTLHLRKPILRTSTKLPITLQLNNILDGRRDNFDGATQSSNTTVDNIEPEFLKNTQTKEPARSSSNERSSLQTSRFQNRAHNGPALSLPMINIDKPTEVIATGGNYHFRGVKQPNKNSDSTQSRHSSKTATSMTKSKPSITVTQTTHLNQHQHYTAGSENLFGKLQPRIENVKTTASVHSGHELRVDDASSNESPTQQKSLKTSAHMYSHKNGAQLLKPTSKVDVDFKKLSFMDFPPTNQSGSSSMRAIAEKSPVVTHHPSKGCQVIPGIHTANISEPIASAKSLATSSIKNSSLPKTIIEQSDEDIAGVLSNVSENDANITSAQQHFSSSLHQRPELVQQLKRRRPQQPTHSQFNHLDSQTQLQRQ